jgi:hypothetical protein
VLRRRDTTSLRHYDRICPDLAAAVSHRAERCREDRDLVAFVEGVELRDSVLVPVPRGDL